MTTFALRDPIPDQAATGAWTAQSPIPDEGLTLILRTFVGVYGEGIYDEGVYSEGGETYVPHPQSESGAWTPRVSAPEQSLTGSWAPRYPLGDSDAYGEDAYGEGAYGA